MKERKLAGTTTTEAHEAERQSKTRRRQAAAQKEKGEVQRRDHGGRGLGGTAQTATREEGERQFKVNLQPHTRGLPAVGKGRKGKKAK